MIRTHTTVRALTTQQNLHVAEYRACKCEEPASSCTIVREYTHACDTRPGSSWCCGLLPLPPLWPVNIVALLRHPSFKSALPRSNIGQAHIQGSYCACRLQICEAKLTTCWRLWQLPLRYKMKGVSCHSMDCCTCIMSAQCPREIVWLYRWLHNNCGRSRWCTRGNTELKKLPCINTSTALRTSIVAMAPWVWPIGALGIATCIWWSRASVAIRGLLLLVNSIGCRYGY